MPTTYPQTRPTEYAHDLGNLIKVEGFDGVTEIQQRVCDLAGIDLVSYLTEIQQYARRYAHTANHNNPRMNAGHAVVILMPIDLWHDLVNWHAENRYNADDTSDSNQAIYANNKTSYLNNAISEMDIFDIYELLGLWRSSGVSDG